MAVLSAGQRKQLEKTVERAREVAELDARAATSQLAVHGPEPFAHLSPDERALRNRVRARARQLGDRRDARNGAHEIRHLVVKGAYEHWHRMLFARFLAENHLRMHPDGVPVTLEECEELAAAEGAADGWELAARMLPQIFRPGAPVLEFKLPPERQRELERLLADLPSEVFQASDSLGWVYQFWQAKKKAEVNRSEVQPAATRLQRILARTFGDDWFVHKQAELLAAVGCAGWTLERWLRDKFFQQHCKLFKNRPFVWHIWDGLKKGGFSALVNYHKLDSKLLETLTCNYLGDWIRRQRDGEKRGEDGAAVRLVAAQALEAKLKRILQGEPPCDIFVRWKPIEKQPLGWDPDLNDGVRLNIRPLMLVGDVGKKGAGVLRHKPNLHWKKDRGKDPPDAPWHPLFKGNRVNDHHLTLTEKQKAREERGGRP